ncbi:MAG TPA: galactokinase family protein [Feifaniaceae bacterium]|nr:galactokinase family protein [Feifaniaceae bacterium]
MLASKLAERITNGAFDTELARVYSDIPAARARCAGVAAGYFERFEERDVSLFSAPGRTEVGGNHTDHNHGAVLAAAVELDMLCAASPTEDGTVELYSEGFGCISVNITDLSMKREEKETSAALIRGVANGMRGKGYRVGGFRAYMVSDVLRGSGLSSSAAFEVLLCCIESHLYNGGGLSPVEAAIISRYAENEYFGKPCGLMDQMACAVGGFVRMDFKDPLSPVVEPIPVSTQGYALCITDTHGNHEGLTPEYGAVTVEMRAVARALGGEVLRDVAEEALYENAAKIRRECGDRAFLRAAHFFRDHARAQGQANALKDGDVERFLALVRESGQSSYMYLQNVYLAGNPKQEPVAAALCLSDHLLRGRGAFRVHGGGFAGTIQAWVPLDILEAYRAGMDAAFGLGSCAVPGIRPIGMARVL